ncbi:MAG: helix-turn-helix domain-containing protein [Acidimicrobiales bacterium]
MARNNYPIGNRLRHAREASQLTLADVAERTGLSKGFISRVERDETSPSVDSLIALCESVGLTMEQLFERPSFAIVRQTNRPQTLMPGTMVTDTLITEVHEPAMTVIETLAGPGGSGGRALYSIAADREVCYVLEGTIEINLDGVCHLLERGDAIAFDAKTPHTWRNCSSAEAARLVWMIAPALPDPLRYGSPAEPSRP